MTISSTLNELSKLALIACDESYFTPTRPIQDNSPLTPLPDTPKYDILPRFLFQQGFFKQTQFEVTELGFKAIVFKNQAVINGPAEYILAFGGTDGPDKVDWTSNTQLGWNQWADNRVQSQIFTFLNSLGANDKITFTGQSLGGALAQYAAYDYIRRKTVNFPGNTDFDPTFDKSRISLITFNGLGGVKALTDNLATTQTPYDPNLLNDIDIGAVAHFYVTNDLVARLGGGHVGGAEYRLDYKADAINPNTGNPYLLDFVNAHRIETGFYAKMEPGGEFLNARLEVVAPLNIESAREYAALFGNLLNNKDLGPEESKFRFAAAVLAGTTFGSPASINTIMQAYLTAERDAGNIGDFWGGILTKINWGAASVLIRPVTGALTPVTLFGAVMADALGAVGTGVQSLFSSLASYFSLVFPGAGPVQPPLESTAMRQLQLEMMLAAAPGALPGNERLTNLIRPLGLDLDQYAQHLLSGTNWFGQTVAYLREQAEANAAPGQEALQANLFLAQLGSAVANLAQELPSISQTELAAITNELNFLVADTAKGTGNAFAELLAKATDAIFSVGQSLNFSQLSLVSEVYAAELKDPRLSPA